MKKTIYSFLLCLVLLPSQLIFCERLPLLFDAISDNNLEEIKKILENPETSHLLEKKHNEHTPLSYAIQEKKWDVAHILINHGANLYKVQSLGIWGKISWQDEDHDNFEKCIFLAFKYAIEHSASRLKDLTTRYYERFQIRFDAVAHNMTYENGDSLLHLVAKSEPKKLRNKKMRLLLDAKIDPNIKNKDKLTPLHLAMKQNDKALFGLLIAYGANIYIPFPKPEEHLNGFSAAVNKPRFFNLVWKAAYQEEAPKEYQHK